MNSGGSAFAQPKGNNVIEERGPNGSYQYRLLDVPAPDGGPTVVTAVGPKDTWSCQPATQCPIPVDLWPGEYADAIYGDNWARFIMQGDGNLVIYQYGIGTVRYTWNSVTYGNHGSYFKWQPDNNLVVYSPTGAALWHSWTFGTDRANSGLFVTHYGCAYLLHYGTGNRYWHGGDTCPTWLQRNI